MARAWFWVGAFGVGLVTAASCSLVNAPDDVKALDDSGSAGPGSGGAGPTGTGGAGGDGGSGGAGCTADADCTALDTECGTGVCDLATGTCELELLAAGTPCGDPAATACSGPDQCDAAGTCTPNDLDGATCGDCAAGPGQCGVCAGGACPDCSAFASTNSFTLLNSVDGWELTGGWALYTEAPFSLSDPVSVPFGNRVFGTDGNRVKPYPGSETEVSTARSRPSVIPASLQFLSWNVDEGGGNIDNKTIRISVDGGVNWTVLVDCNGGSLPFCFNVQTRAADDWDPITIDTSAFAGQTGIIEFGYNTGDSCCDFERGWFIDVTNFAGTCACAATADCVSLDDACGNGACNAVSGECGIVAQAAGTACGDASTSTCTAPDTCDGAGFCGGQHVNSIACEDCAAGPGLCDACSSGQCLDCAAFAPTNAFNGPNDILGWQLTGGWGLFTSAPPTTVTPTPLFFGNSVFGTDGNRSLPYPGGELENSFMRTRPSVLPATLTFSSWNQDEDVDTKKISVSVDGGVNWTVLFDCANGPSLPFCLTVNNRPAAAWDPIQIDNSAFAGQVGIIEFAYNTQDSCCAFERGWFIDDANFALPCQ